MRYALVLAGLLMVGCSQSNFTEFTKAMAEVQKAIDADQRCGCVMVNAGPYGGVTMARGNPECAVQVSASGCVIEGSNVTKITVPTGSVTVQPK